MIGVNKNGFNQPERNQFAIYDLFTGAACRVVLNYDTMYQILISYQII
jgi:hypothetical protein